MVISPPVTNKNPPIVAMTNPIILKVFSFSLKKIDAKIVMITGVIKEK